MRFNEETIEQQEQEDSPPAEMFSMIMPEAPAPELRVIGIYGDVNEEKCSEAVYGLLAYHLSENKSKSDDNLEFTNNSWFWKYIKKNAKYCSVEVYDKKINKLKNLIKLVDRKINL